MVRFIFLDDFSSFWIINLTIHQQIKQNNYPYVNFLFQKDACLIIFNFYFPKKLPKQAFFCSFGQFNIKLSKLLCFPPISHSCPGRTASFFFFLFFTSHQTKQVAMLPTWFLQLSWPDSYFLSLVFSKAILGMSSLST